MGIALTGELHVLGEACKRRSMAEIEIDCSDGTKRFARARLLACDNESVMLDRPRHGDMPMEIGGGTSAVVHFLYDGERYEFRSRVDQEGLMPCDGDVVQGVTFDAPQEVQRQERRTDCRVSLAGCGEVTGYFRRLPPDGDSPFPARLMNISAGGMAALVLDDVGHSVARGNQYLVEFQLPGVPRTFCFRTTLCHVRELKGGIILMGLKYLPETNAAEMRHAIRQISQFVAKELGRTQMEES
jgi:c-di-GMP-binding flagellar brake protein YcgR